EHPLIIVVCVDIAETHPTDTELERLSIVGGASVYPMAQNLCLALRAHGVASSFTTLLVAAEPAVKRLLEIPEQYSTACHIAAGYPLKPFPTKLRRSAVEEIAFVDRFGDPFAA
ncbi:MAG TPA: nitroreductase family protein, partial [Solirubrobacteraceae bacterium]